MTRRRFRPKLFTVRCTGCGTELIPGKKFCHVCGTQVGLSCVQCGAALESGFRFCPDCGTPVGEPSAEEPPPSPLGRQAPQIPEGLAQKIRASKDTVEGERKQVTVLFCDLVGSTAIAERLDPEEYHDLLEQYLQIAFREIYRFEGIVNQLAGDGLMALFGAPVAHEDAPQRAVWAALAIRDELGRFNERRLRAGGGPELRARFGINTGPVVVGTVGNDLKMDYTAIGDTTNLASRLESLARPGTVLVSEATHRLAQGLFDVRPAGPFTVKGKAEPVVAYEIIGVSDAETPMAIAAGRGLTPFVGRSDELSHIQMCFERLTGKLAQAVAIVGPAGSGKSRLLYEFRQWLAQQPAVVFEARCSALSQMVPYAPWGIMLRQYFGLSATEAPETVRAAVFEKVCEVDPELEAIAPHLGHILAVPDERVSELPVEEMKRATFEAVARLIDAEAHRGPVVMIIEDLHWIDEPSREMLERAMTGLSGRMMLIVSHRPEYQPSWRTPAAFTQLNLNPLSDDDARQIIRALVGASLPAELEQLILAKAEGSPFFAEEITRSLLEGGYLTRDNGHARLTRPVEEIRIPGTVQEVIAARLDRLSGGAKRVVQVAAVIGRQFRRDQLEGLLAADGIDVQRELEILEQRGVIHRKHLFSTDEFRFGESLTQEVAYEGLLLKQRRQLHERVGALLAAGGDDGPERSALLAHHLARSENRQQAVEALLRAARDAERVPSYHTAARFYREAWDLVEPQLAVEAAPELVALGMAAAVGVCRMDVLYGAPDPGDNERVVQTARELAVARGDASAEAEFCTYQGMMMLGQRERFSEGLALIEEGIAVARQAGLPLAAMLRGLAWAYLLDGRFALARQTIDASVAGFEHTRDAKQLSDVYLSARFLRAEIVYHSDDLSAAVAEATAAHELGVRAGNRTVQGGTAAILAQVHYLRGQYAEAKRRAKQSLELHQALGYVGPMRTEAAILLGAAIELGVPVSATRCLELLQPDAPLTHELAMSIHVVVDVLLMVGEVKRAERCARAAYDRASGCLREMSSAVALGDALSRLGPERLSEAMRFYERALSLAETIGARVTIASARLGMAEVSAARGEQALAARHLCQMAGIARELGLVRHQARAERLQAAAEISAAV